MDPILNRARALFPVNDYGRAGMLTHPGTRICAVKIGRETDVMLISNTARTLRNGRYYPGWDCFEASYYLLRQLKRAGIDSTLLVTKSPIYSLDTAVLVEDTLVSITPGVPTFRDFLPDKGNKIFSDHVKLWKYRAKEGMSLTDHMILGWEDLGKFSFLHSAGVDLMSGNVFKALVISMYVSDGKIFCSGHSSFYSHFSELESFKEGFLAGDHRSAFDRLKTDRWAEHYDVPENTTKEESLAMERASLLSQDIIPKMFRIIDADWFNRQGS